MRCGSRTSLGWGEEAPETRTRDLGQKPKHRKEPSIPGGKTRQLLNTPRIRKAFLRVIQNLEDLKKLINLTLKIQESLHDEKAA